MPDPILATEIGTYDKVTRTVPVTFTLGDIVHLRSVNACLDAKGRYDAKATTQRVAQVAAGVTVKIAAGAINNPPPAPQGEEQAAD